MHGILYHLEKSINEGINGDVVSGLSTDKTDLTVTRMYARKGGSGEVAYAYDLCFEVQFTDAQYARLFDKKNKNRYLFAWAWTINKQAISEYKRVANIPVGTAKERLEFLKQGEQSYLEYAIDYYKEKLLSGSYLPRHQYGAAGFVDNFPFDEPSCNFLKVENALPFSFFGAGAQFGPIGLCRNDSEYHKKYISKYPATEDFIVKEGEKLRDATLPELYLDESCGSDGGGAVQFGHGLLSDQDEYHSFGDHCFLFKKDSAVLKINSIEGNSGKAVSISKAYSFSSGKCDIVFHDYVADYKDRFKDVLLMQFDIVMEQKVVDFNEFATLQIAQEDSLKSEDGEVLTLIEKGVPGYGYTGRCHTDVKLRGQKNAAQLWEAHTLVHRPLIIVYELERDLTTEEVDVLRKTPIICTFQFGTIGRLKSAEYKIPIDTTNGVKKGRHAIFVYLVSKSPRVEVVITDDTLVPAVDRIAGCGEKSKYRGFNWPLSGLPQVTLYENRNETGLFENNPVVIINDFSWSDIAAKNNTDARAAAARAMNSKCMGFLLSFVPYVGDIAGTAWDIGVEMLEGKPVNDATKITISKKAMNLFLECLQKATTPAAGTRSSGLPNFKELGKGPGKALDFFVVLATIEQVLKGYFDTVAKTSSSFLRGVDFGKGDKDSLYLMAVMTIQLNQNSKTLEYSKVETPDTVEIFMNRELTGDDHQPFNIQLGATAGLLQRADANQPDSVACFRAAYMQNLAKLQSILREEKQDSVGDYLNKLLGNRNGDDLLKMFEKGNVSKKFTESLKSKRFLDVLEKKVKGGTFSEDEAAKLSLIINLLRYIDVVFVTCPACGHIVLLSWGWCPYHGTAEELKLEDKDGDGMFKNEFVKCLKSNKMEGISSHLSEDFNSQKRLLVHWTEFIIG